MEVTSALPAAGGWWWGITWSCEGIYNKVALAVVLKTFIQLYISTSAAANKHTTQLNKEAAGLFVFFLMVVTGWRERGEKDRNSLRWSTIHEIILALPALWVSPLPHPSVGLQVSGTKSHPVSFINHQDIFWLLSIPLFLICVFSL